jgi:hypothetical protein
MIMNKTWAPGICIAVFCGIWQLIMGITGWYKDPVMMNMFWVVIPIQVICLIWGLSRTAKEGKRYLAQVGLGTCMSLIAGVFLFFVSYIFTAVLYPNYFADMKVIQENALQKAGTSPEQIKIVMDLYTRTANSFSQATMGFLGTVFTGFVCSIIIGAFLRKRN